MILPNTQVLMDHDWAKTTVHTTQEHPQVGYIEEPSGKQIPVAVLGSHVRGHCWVSLTEGQVQGEGYKRVAAKTILPEVDPEYH